MSRPSSDDPGAAAASDDLGAAAAFDGLGVAAFGELMSPLFEAAPRFIARLEGGRPYGSWDTLFARATEIALEMPEAERIELIDAHPRIGAPPGSVSALSFAEQGYDQASATTEAEDERTRIQAELDRLNASYEAQFGFRYVIFVAGRPRASIVPMMVTALGADSASEQQRALRDVVAIARDRAIKTGLMTDHTRAG